MMHSTRPIDELLMLLLPDDEESLQAGGAVVGSAEAERSVSATKLCDFMTTRACAMWSGSHR